MYAHTQDAEAGGSRVRCLPILCLKDKSEGEGEEKGEGEREREGRGQRKGGGREGERRKRDVVEIIQI